MRLGGLLQKLALKRPQCLFSASFAENIIANLRIYSASQSLEELAERYENAPSTKNPWPEDSDYGKLWRKGYRAGVFDQQGKSIAAALRARTQGDTE
jgi:hypothetical protein